MKIAILTHHWVMNFGANLQALATYNFLKLLGHEVIFLNYRPPQKEIAARLNIQLLKPADFNSKLRERGVDKKVTVQKICKACKDEKQVRAILDEVWKIFSRSENILNDVFHQNDSVFSFERLLTYDGSRWIRQSTKRKRGKITGKL